MRIGKNKKNISIGELRETQIITTFGPGAIVNLPKASAIMSSIDSWPTSSWNEIPEKNLSKLLRVHYFYSPPTSPEGGGNDILAIRFPRVYYCPKCGVLRKANKFSKNSKGILQCPKCNVSVIPSRFVVSCINGHIDDFPFNWWVHQGHYEENHDLRVDFKTNTGGLDSIVITCTTCGAHRSMKGCMARNALKGYHCHGNKYWFHHFEREDCAALVRTLQRSASNIYFPVTVSALTLPDESDDIMNLYNHLPTDQRDILLKTLDSTLEVVLQVLFASPLRKHEVSLNDLKYTYINKIRPIWLDDSEHTKFTEQMLYEEEYNYLCGGTKTGLPQYCAEEVQVPVFVKDYISQVVLVKRLREVMALRGFRRIFPEYPDSLEEAEGDDNFKGWNGENYIAISEKDTDWLPAIEMLGEGIFLRLNEEKLTYWEKAVGNRYIKMGLAASKTRKGKKIFSTRYVLLHTLAHLLMRQLSLECGYSGASIRERIYSTFPQSSYSMSGILIYTSSSDSDGSLGGLVRMGKPENLEQIIRDMLHEASWCSSDPICIESEGQGYMGANYAACHACTLVSETSCEAGNIMLDRAAVVGTLENRQLGYMSDLLDERK